MALLTTNPYLMALLGGLVFSAATFGLCQFLLARRVRELTARIEKSERARAATSQQAQQARKQVEQLQKELAAQHKARAEAVLARRRSENQERQQQVQESRRLALDSLLMHDEAPSRPAHGFADTMPFLDSAAKSR